MIPSKGLLILELTLEDNSKEPYFVNCRSPKSLSFSLYEIAAAVPQKLKLDASHESQIAALISGETEGAAVVVTKVRQESDPTRYNLRLAPQLKNAELGDLTAFARSLMVAPLSTEREVEI